MEMVPLSAATHKGNPNKVSPSTLFSHRGYTMPPTAAALLQIYVPVEEKNQYSETFLLSPNLSLVRAKLRNM